MGWFTRILSSGDKTDIVSDNAVSLHVYDLQEWLLTQRQELLANTKLGDESLLYINTLKDRRWMLECSLDKWEEKVLRLGNDPRLKEIKALFKQTRKMLELDIPKISPEMTLENILTLNQRMEISLKELLAAVQKSFFAENYSFIIDNAEQPMLNPLLQNLLEMDSLRKRFTEKIAHSGLRMFDLLAEKAILLEQYTDRLKHLQREAALKKERLHLAEARRQQKETEFGVFQEGSHYSSWKQLEYRRSQLREQQGAQEAVVVSFFRHLMPALQPFYVHNPSLKSYSSDPVKALYVDEEMGILSLLQQVKNALRAGSLSLPPEQASSILNRLENSSLNLAQVRKDSLDIKQELDTLHQSMRHTDFMMKMEEAQYRLDHFVQQAVKMKKEVETIQEEINEKESLRAKELEFFRDAVRSTLGKEMGIKV